MRKVQRSSPKCLRDKANWPVRCQRRTRQHQVGGGGSGIRTHGATLPILKTDTCQSHFSVLRINSEHCRRHATRVAPKRDKAEEPNGAQMTTTRDLPTLSEPSHLLASLDFLGPAPLLQREEVSCYDTLLARISAE